MDSTCPPPSATYYSIVPRIDFGERYQTYTRAYAYERFDTTPLGQLAGNVKVAATRERRCLYRRGRTYPSEADPHRQHVRREDEPDAPVLGRAVAAGEHGRHYTRQRPGELSPGTRMAMFPVSWCQSVSTAAE